MASNAPNPTTDEGAIGRVCDVLANRRRRAVIDYLRTEADGAVPVETIVEEALSPKRTPATELSHVHLPKLDDAGVVSYAPDEGTVEYVGGETIEALLDAVDGSSGTTDELLDSSDELPEPSDELADFLE